MVITWPHNWDCNGKRRVPVIPMIVVGGRQVAAETTAPDEAGPEEDDGFARLVEGDDSDELPYAEPVFVMPSAVAVPTPDRPPIEGGGDSAKLSELAACETPEVSKSSQPLPRVETAAILPSEPPMSADTNSAASTQTERQPDSAGVQGGVAESALLAQLEPFFNEAQAADTDVPLVETAALTLDPLSMVRVDGSQPGATIASPPVSQAAPSVSAAIPRHPLLTAAQIVVQILPQRDEDGREVEVLLAPEELGRLRFVIQHDAGAVRISLTAERPETLDLLRRHADQLAQEFRQSGYGGATIDFGRWRQGGGKGQPFPAREEVSADTAAPVLMQLAIPQAALPAVHHAQGLNIRL